MEVYRDFVGTQKKKFYLGPKAAQTATTRLRDNADAFDTCLEQVYAVDSRRAHRSLRKEDTLCYLPNAASDIATF